MIRENAVIEFKLNKDEPWIEISELRKYYYLELESEKNEKCDLKGRMEELESRIRMGKLYVRVKHDKNSPSHKKLDSLIGKIIPEEGYLRIRTTKFGKRRIRILKWICVDYRLDSFIGKSRYVDYIFCIKSIGGDGNGSKESVSFLERTKNWLVKICNRIAEVIAG